MEHWVAGWGREGHASDHVAVFDDEQRARDWQGWWLVRIAGRADAAEDAVTARAARAALAEIHDGYGATGDVDGKTHWVSACETEGCPFPDAACVDARAALAGIGDARLLL
jgi:hypothetical protein